MLFGWLTVAALDISDAFIFWYLYRGITPGGILRAVARGFLGPAAASGGAAVELLGAAIHLTVALGVMTTFVLVSARLPALRRRPLLFGPLYGVAVYCVMYYAVMPLSRIGWPAFSWVPFINNVFVAHMWCVGFPAAWWASRIGSPRVTPA